MPASTLGIIASSYRASSFVPTQIADLQMWFDADNAASLGGTAPNVASWADLSGNGFTMTAGGTQPVRSVGGLKTGRTSIDFTSSRPLDNSAGANQKPLTAFVVLKHSGGATDRAFLGNNNGGGFLWELPPNQKQLVNKHLIANIAFSTSVVPANVTVVLAVSYSSAGEMRFYLNGTADGTTTNDQTFSASPATTMIGDGSGQPFIGTIGEIVKYARVLSDAERNQVHAYLTGRWQ